MSNMQTTRFVSRLTRGTLALILSGGRGARLKMLTDWRAKPAVPFGGKFRIVDFALSNCLNSGIRRISVLTQYKSHSLIGHIMDGWNNLRSEYGEFVELVPAQQWVEEDTWYQGTADAVYQSLDIIASHRPEFILILAGDHVYKMDYGEMLAAHAAAKADLTVACNTVPLTEASKFGVMSVDENNRILEFQEKPDDPRPLPADRTRALVSMGVYVFSFDYLMSELQRDAEDRGSSHDFGNDIIPYAITNEHQVQAFPMRTGERGDAYWRDVGTIDSYYQANIELTGPEPALDLYDPHWPIWTYQAQLPSAKFIGKQTADVCGVSASTVSGGCVVDSSQISRSLLFSNVKVDSGCVLEGVLALPDCVIGSGCRLSKVILDNGCEVPAGTVIGEDPIADAERYYRTEDGIVVANRSMFGQEREYRPAIAPR
ncbi:MAG: glucose-1-phosphate adenylyltransferase [Gammaproteobacteria bacterium]|jgi:glucose-1-phosphate adenylyltransferase|nr:glucose-1-phosphate adenylyltransferase [Gammaproteobacteria bacterium]